MEASESCDCRYFAVFVPPLPTDAGCEVGAGGDDLLTNSSGDGGKVFTSLEDALQEISRMKNRNPRFKPFNSAEAASYYVANGRFLTDPRRLFSSNESASPLQLDRTAAAIVGQSKNEAVEKPLPFDKPSWSALGQLKRMIEKGGDTEVIHQTLRNNPRLIINSSGYVIPTVMHQGCLYQPMHIACKAGRLDVCRLLLDSAEEFMALLYPEEKELNETRCDDLRSGFLNRPDKFGETPLFFAVKGGFVEVVQFLLLQPQCDRHVRNTRGESCYDLCERLQSPAKETLKKMLTEQLLFVPLFRTVDNSDPPCLGRPCPHLLFESDVRLQDDLSISPGQTVRNAIVKRRSPMRDNTGNYPFLAAWLGPCSPAVAKDLYDRWSSCKKENGWAIDVKRSDLQKGMERYGRYLSDEFGVSWAEYWNFLDAFTDIRKDSGLDIFERFLRNRRATAKQHEDLQAGKAAASCLSEEVSTRDSINDEFHDSLEALPTTVVGEDNGDVEDDVDFLCQKFSLLGLNSPCVSVVVEDEDSEDEIFCTPPCSPTFFISDAFPSKLDRDVFLALEHIYVDPLRFPNVHRWYQSVMFYGRDEQMRWPNFDSPRAKQRSRTATRNV